MKLAIALSTLLLLPTPILAQNRSQRGYSYDQRCYENIYREEYIPGTRRNPGYVRRRSERVEVPCRNNTRAYTPHRNHNTDNNSCIEGSIIGALLGHCEKQFLQCAILQDTLHTSKRIEKKITKKIKKKTNQVVVFIS